MSYYSNYGPPPKFGGGHGHPPGATMPGVGVGVPVGVGPVGLAGMAGMTGVVPGNEHQQMGSLRRLDSTTVRTHFYPEGGWGWIVCACAFLAHVTTSGAQLSAGALHIVVANKFQDNHTAHWLGPFSWSISSMCSPLVVNLCRRKNVRVVSLVGGCLFPLSLLCTSFATEIHQFFFCFGLMGGIGSCLVRESSTVVLGEYFRRRRQFAEQVVLAGTGVGVTLFSLLYLSLGRHIEWSQGFQIGAGLSLISVVLPAFYRAAAYYHPQRAIIQQLQHQKAQRPPKCSEFLMPLTGDIFKNLKLFCIPSLKPVLWSAGISSFGLYAPAFLMSDFGKREGLTGGSLLLLQTHLGLGLSLGVILGAILTLKKFRCCHVSPRMLCCTTGILTGLSMIAISSVKGYYGYSLSAWIYGIGCGSYIYSLKILCMDLTRTKHWERIWSCVQSLMGPGALIGTGLTSYLGKSSFYACATCVLLGSGIIGMELIDLSKCGSPQLSSDNESPIPPAPPLIQPNKYGQSIKSGLISNAINPPSSSVLPTVVQGGFHPLRRSLSLQQPMYPYYGENLTASAAEHSPFVYSPFCPDCNPSSAATAMPGGHHPLSTFYPPQMVRSFSQPQFKNTGTQTHPNTPVLERPPQRGRRGQGFTSQSSSSFDQIPVMVGGTHHFHPHPSSQPSSNQGSQAKLQTQPSSRSGSGTLGRSSQKYSVMFASNPQLFPEHVHVPPQQQTQKQKQKQQAAAVVASILSNKLTQQTPDSRIKSTTSSTRSSTERFPDIPIEPQFGHYVPHQNEAPAFTRHYFDSSQMVPPHKRQEKLAQAQQIQQRQQQQQQPYHSQTTTKLPSHHQQSNVALPATATSSSTARSHSPHSSRHQQQPQHHPSSSGNQDGASSILNPNKLVLTPNPIIHQPQAQYPYGMGPSGGGAGAGSHHQNQHQRSGSSGGGGASSNHVMINPLGHTQTSSGYVPPPQLPYPYYARPDEPPQQPQQYYPYPNARPSGSSHHHYQNEAVSAATNGSNFQRRNSFNTHAQKQPGSSHHPKVKKVSSYEFDIEEPKFHSLRKPSSSSTQPQPTTSATPTPPPHHTHGHQQFQQPHQQQQQHVSTISKTNHSFGDYGGGGGGGSGDARRGSAPYYYIDRDGGGGGGGGAPSGSGGGNVFQIAHQQPPPTASTASTQQQQHQHPPLQRGPTIGFTIPSSRDSRGDREFDT